MSWCWPPIAATCWTIRGAIARSRCGSKIPRGAAEALAAEAQWMASSRWATVRLTSRRWRPSAWASDITRPIQSRPAATSFSHASDFAPLGYWFPSFIVCRLAEGPERAADGALLSLRAQAARSIRQPRGDSRRTIPRVRRRFPAHRERCSPIPTSRASTKIRTLSTSGILHRRPRVRARRHSHQTAGCACSRSSTSPIRWMARSSKRPSTSRPRVRIARDEDAISSHHAGRDPGSGPHAGPIHAEMRVNRRGVWMLEVAARPIGGLVRAGAARIGRADPAPRRR